jgi:hypothetical protein
MSALAISLITFAFVFGGALLGMFLRAVLPEHHLSPDSRDVVKLGTGLIATMAALVLGLLIASAKSSYDTQSNELTDMSSKVILLDRVLAHYGPEAKEARDQLHGNVIRILDQMWPKAGAGDPSQLDISSPGAEVLYDKIQELSPKDEKQRTLQTTALSVAIELGKTRLLMYEQGVGSISFPMLVVLIFWLTIIFISFGLFAPLNPTVIGSLFVCALSVSAAILLILEMYTPYAGLIQISSAPLRAALAHLGK